MKKVNNVDHLYISNPDPLKTINKDLPLKRDNPH